MPHGLHPRAWRVRYAMGALLVVASLLLAGSGATETGFPGSASSADQQVLRQVLAAWAGFPVSASPRPLLLLGGAGETTASASFGFPNGADKMAFGDGAIDPPAAWPKSPGEAAGYRLITAAAAFGEFTPPAGTARPPATTRLRTGAVTLGSAGFATDRGQLELPAWVFTFEDVPGWVAVLAVAPASVYPMPAAVTPQPGEALAGGVELGSDGRTLTVDTGGWRSGSGPCEAEYHLQVAWSDTAVAIVVDERANPMPSGAGCALPYYFVRLTTVLPEPLGAEVVVNARAQPIEVTENGTAT